MYIIPITPDTLELIEVLNNGVRPELEDQETHYVFKGKDEYAEILTRAEVDAMPEGYRWNAVQILTKH